MNLNQIAGKRSKIDFEDIDRRQQELLVEINWKQQRITNYAKQVAAPFIPSETNEHNSLVKKVSKGMAIFDGVLVGIKIIKNTYSFFKRKRK